MNATEVVSSYSRAQALADGVLVDAGKLARDAGFQCDVAVTQAAWAKCVAVPPGWEGLQDVMGRLWDVLWMASCAARAGRGGQRTDRLSFTLRCHTEPFSETAERAPRSRVVGLALVVGHGDHGEQVATIMMADED